MAFTITVSTKVYTNFHIQFFYTKELGEYLDFHNYINCIDFHNYMKTKRHMYMYKNSTCSHRQAEVLFLFTYTNDFATSSPPTMLGLLRDLARVSRVGASAGSLV